MQGQADGQHVDHHQVGQARGNRRVGVGVEDQVDGNQYSGQVGQRRARWGQHDDVGATAARQFHGADQGGAVAALRDGHQAVATAQQGGGDAVDVRVAVGHRRHARAEELVLRVGRHDAGRALAIEFDLAGARQDVERALDRFRVQVVA
ncbi:hypothetical protein D3C81_1554840 [compost metagenome]